MSRRNFWIPVGVVLFCFIAANFAMARWVSHLHVAEKLNAIDSAAGANVLVLGNSLLDFTLDARVFQDTARRASANLIPLNEAVYAMLPPEHYLLFKQALRLPNINTVVVGFFDFQLTMNIRSTVDDLGFRGTVAFDPRTDPRDAESIYRFSPGETLRFRLFRHLPLMASRFVIGESVEQLRREIRGPGPTWDEGMVADFNAWAPAFEGDVTHLNDPMERVVRESRKRRYQVIFVLMPMSPGHLRDCYAQPRWKHYMAALTRLLAEYRCGFVDASTWFPSEKYFADSIHISSKYKEPLSAKLAEAIVAERSAMQSKWPDR